MTPAEFGARMRALLREVPAGHVVCVRDDELVLVPAAVARQGRRALPRDLRQVIELGRVGLTEAA